MKTKSLCIALVSVMLPIITLHLSTALAQTTAFTYQGRLIDNGVRANGIYDLRFAIYDSQTDGNVIGDSLTNSSVTVSNGLFTTQLNFGADVFTNSPLWLEVGERTNGVGDFTTLAPRQELTAVPYAIQAANALTANSVSAANITGAISSAQLPSSVVTNGASGVTINGTFTGNGTGVTNILFSSVGNGALKLVLGQNFSAATYGVGSNTAFVVATDVNGDGKMDLISANANDNTLTVLTNNDSGIFVSNATYAVGNSPRCVAAADVNGDGKVDLISANYNGETLTVLTNNGSGIFGFNATINVGTNCIFVTAADLNGDGKPDLITANDFAHSLTVFMNNGSGVFGSNAIYIVVPGYAFPVGVAAADVNGDGKLDLISANYDAANLTVLTNDGSGNFTVSSSPGGIDYSESVAAADVNGDGKIDLISADSAGNELIVLINDGSGNFPNPNPDSYGLSFTPLSVVAADINGDGKPDLICAGGTGSGKLEILTNDGSGDFTAAQTNTVGANPKWVAAADINGDGAVDLISANSHDNSLTVLTQIPQIISTTALTFTNSQNDFSGAFTGDGGGLTNLSASQLSSGTIALTQLPASVVTNGASGVTVNGAFTGNGGGLTNLNVNNLTGIIADAQLSANVALLNGTNQFTGSNNFAGVTIATNVNNQLTGIFTGNGGGLTGLNAAQITNGTFTGDGSGLTNLDAAQINGSIATPQITVNGNGKITGGLAIDAAAANAGVISSNTSLLFGGPGSGEGIGSERVTNGPAKQYSLDFYTSSSQRMTILLNGNVGIGTNAPATLLDVAGNIHAAGTFIGNGSGLMNLNAAQVSGVVTNNQNGVVLNGTFSGDGGGLTNTVTSGNYLFAYRTGVQSFSTDVGSFSPVLFSTVASVNGWTYANGNKSAFTNAQTGLYLIQYTAMADEGFATYSGPTPQVSLNVTVNGVEIPGSETMTTLPINGKAFLLSTSFVASLNSNNVVALQFTASDGQVQLNNQGYGTTKPVATLTITRLQ